MTRILHLNLKRAHKRSDQRPQLRLCETLPDAAARAMQEGHIAVVAAALCQHDTCPKAYTT